MDMNYYEYVLYKSLPIKNDLTVFTDNLNYNDNIFDNNLISSSVPNIKYIDDKNNYSDSYGMQATISNFDNNKYFRNIISNEIGVKQETIYTLTYSIYGNNSDISFEFYDKYLSDDPLNIINIKDSTELKKEWNVFERQIIIPDGATTVIIKFNGNNCLYNELSFAQGCPQVIENNTYQFVISRLANKFLSDMDTFNITFEDPTGIVKKLKDSALLNQSPKTFYLFAICLLELRALAYYQKNDQDSFDLLRPEDFYRIQSNILYLKNILIKDSYNAINFLLTVDELLRDLGYMQTAFNFSTKSIPEMFGGR